MSAKKCRHCRRSEVVRGGVEPPTFRFSGGLASPGVSTTGRLTRPYDELVLASVQDQPQVSTAAVSKALARSADEGPEGCSAREF